jgi:hypothetical protein
MNLTEAYKEVYYSEEDFLMDLIEMCLEFDLFDDVEDTIFFAEELINQDVYTEFLGELAEIVDIDTTQYLTENRGKLAYSAFRGLVNALSAAGRTKAGVKAGTALGKTPEKIVKGAAASTSIRSARAARTPAPAQPQAGRYLKTQELKRSIQKATQTRALPASGQSGAASLRAVTQRGTARHNQAMAAGQQAINQAKTVAAAFLKAMKHGEAKAKLTKAAAGTKGTEVRIAGGAKTPKRVTGAAADPWKQFPGKKPAGKLAVRTPKPEIKPTMALPPAKETPKMPSTLRKDIRATGPGGDARTQRLASQAAPGSGLNPREVKAQANRMTSGADALNKARRALAGAAAAGVAASAAAPLVQDTAKKSKPESSSVNKYNTMDSDGKVRSRLKVGPKIVGTGSVAGDFDVAFKKARTSGAKEFEFQGKKYTTKMRGEEVDYFDIVMETLITEGYVDTNEDALIMMSNLDEAAIGRIIARALPGIIKTGGEQLKKIKLPPKLSLADRAMREVMRKHGMQNFMGTKEHQAAKAAAPKPAPKPAPKADNRTWQQRYEDEYNKNYNSSGGFRKSAWD